MGRPSKLTSIQEREICQALATGESNRSVAKRYGVGEATIRRIFSAQVPKVKDVAQRLASAEGDLAQLPVSAQHAARNLADQLKTIGSNLARAACAGSDTAARLAEQANREAIQEGGDLMKVAMLTKVANEAASPALAMLSANKSRSDAKELGPITVVTGVPDAGR